MSLTYETFIPRPGFLLVQEEEQEEIRASKGGIHLPDSAEQSSLRYAEVVKGSALVGAIVAYNDYSAMDMPLERNGRPLRMVRINELLGANEPIPEVQ